MSPRRTKGRPGVGDGTMAPTEPPPHDPPYPPWRLARRIGGKRMADDPWESYERVGAVTREAILRLLPDDWEFAGRRVLDFGCGAGRTLRHFLGEARVGEFHGCDIDDESIAWLEANLSPPLHVFKTEQAAYLKQPDRTYDLVYCASVFTHIAQGWAEWALELRRVLKPDGLMIVTFISPAGGAKLPQAALSDATVDSDHVGMNAFGAGRVKAAPVVVHSEWWLRAHWGRAFEILELAETGFRHPGDQGYLLMRKRPVEVTADDLEAPEPGEAREVLAARENVRQLVGELEYAWQAWEELNTQLAGRFR